MPPNFPSHHAAPKKLHPPSPAGFPPAQQRRRSALMHPAAGTVHRAAGKRGYVRFRRRPPSIENNNLPLYCRKPALFLFLDLAFPISPFDDLCCNLLLFFL